MGLATNSEFKTTLYGIIDNAAKDGMVYDPTYQINVPVETSKEMIDIVVNLCDEAGIEMLDLEDITKTAGVARQATDIYLEKGFISQEVHDRAMVNIDQTLEMANV